jgi:hypothetical protein
MATQVQWRGGSTAEHATFTGAAREVTVDTQKQTLVVHDGSTAGGEALLREDQANLPGSVTNGIYTPGTNQVAVATNGTGRLFVDANGNVGVGLSGPSYPLEVAAPTDSTINITGGTSNVCRLFFSDTALARGFLNYAHADDSLHIGTAGTERLRIDSAGNVGIGTSSPANFAGFVTLALADSSGAEVDFIKGSTVQGSLYNASDIFYIESKSTVPTAFVTNGSERLRITSAGLVGIGTSSPVATNHIRGSGTSGQVTASWMLENTSSGSVGMDVTGAAGSSIWRFLYGNGPQTGTNAFTPALTIGVEGATAGNVGIGTTSPGSTLDINGDCAVANTKAYQVKDSGGTVRYAMYMSGSLSPSAGNDLFIGNTLANSLVLYTNSAERARIDSSGRLLVGTSTVTTTASSSTNNLLAVESANNYLGVSFTANCNDSNGSYLVLKKSRGTITGSTTVVQSGDEIGNIFFEATDGSASRSAAAIRAFVDGTPGSADMPGRLVFSTTADGASAPTERMRITSTGQVRLAGAGITFNGDTAAANELDDYEEGTWTASITGGTFDSLVNGRYTKVGRQVFASMNPGVTAITGNLVISGLPFVAGVRSSLVVATIAPGGVTYVPDFVDAAQMLVTVTGTYSGGSVSTYFACVYEV